MSGPFDIYGSEQDSWSLQGELGSLVYPLGFLGAGWATRRGGMAMAQGRSFWGGVFGAGRNNPLITEQLENTFMTGASRRGLYSAEARISFQRAVQASAGTGRLSSTAGRGVGGRIVATNLPAGYFDSALNARAGAKWLRFSTSSKFASRTLGAYVMSSIAFNLGEMAGNAVAEYRPRRLASPASEFGSITPMDSRMGYTQRQRAIAAIHDSFLSTRATIGNEASFLHQ